MSFVHWLCLPDKSDTIFCLNKSFVKTILWAIDDWKSGSRNGFHISPLRNVVNHASSFNPASPNRSFKSTDRKIPIRPSFAV